HRISIILDHPVIIKLHYSAVGTGTMGMLIKSSPVCQPIGLLLNQAVGMDKQSEITVAPVNKEDIEIVKAVKAVIHRMVAIDPQNRIAAEVSVEIFKILEHAGLVSSLTNERAAPAKANTEMDGKRDKIDERQSRGIFASCPSNLQASKESKSNEFKVGGRGLAHTSPEVDRAKSQPGLESTSSSDTSSSSGEDSQTQNE
ncbi:unnamed protein product, partial [Owenia fusiformis]